MDKAAAASLDSWIYTVDGLDVTAWLDGAPVIIKVPILNEQREWQGDSRYYFKQGKLFAVQMPYGSYQFDSKGAMIPWLDETGVQSELPGTVARWPPELVAKPRSATGHGLRSGVPTSND